ncbi:MAG: AAA family ATPase [Ruminiclostridium sp.]
MNVKAQRILDQLETMPGMAHVRIQVERIMQLKRVTKLREMNGLKVEPCSNHMVFTGNPGTGKTSAARMIGKAFAAMGLLKLRQSNPNEATPFIEIHHADVESELVGVAEKKIKMKFEEAEEGVLFIDEAYSFLGRAEHKSSEKTMAVIVQMMEDMRDRIMVIVAGYPKEMEDFLNYNPGLRSRFSNTVHFPDYGVRDLLLIASHMCSERDYKMTEEYKEKLSLRLNQEILLPGFGNARTVRNLIEYSIKTQALRISNIVSPTRRDLVLLTKGDAPECFTSKLIENEIEELLS